MTDDNININSSLSINVLIFSKHSKNMFCISGYPWKIQEYSEFGGTACYNTQCDKGKIIAA